MNKFLFSLRKNLAGMISPVKNSMSLPQQFLRYGLRGQPMYPNWTEVQMSDYDHYSGYSYAAIVKRANMVARVALDKVRTESKQKNFVHPYLNVISASPTFSDYYFWSTISVYLDLEGWFPLLAVRNFDGQRFGNIQEFKLLNPYRVRRVTTWNEKGLQIGGYIETNRGGFYREIPPEQIIDIRELNPFDEEVPFAKSDAAKDPQFVMKSASDYTRHALRNNTNFPGVLSTDIKLEEEDFKNFMNRVRNHIKGEPIFGNGEGAIKFASMQNNLKDQALKDINDVQRDISFAVYGVSKTVIGIEESGTTRDTSEVQKELMFEGQVLPQIQKIIDALNQDYKNNAPDFKNNQADIVVDNPISPDYEQTVVYIDMLTKQVDLFSSLINRGIDPTTAAKFVDGDASLLDLKNIKPAPIPPNPGQGDNGDGTEPEGEGKDGGTEPEGDKGTGTPENKLIASHKNEVSNNLILQQQGALLNAIIRVDQGLLHSALQRLPVKLKNSVDLREKDVLTQQDQNEAEKDLEVILFAFYGIVVNLHGQSVMRDRMGQYALAGNFVFNRNIQSVLKTYATKAASSHIATVSQQIYKTAHDAALEGKSLAQVEQLLRNTYNDSVSKNRAKTIARTETNRAFTTAQYEADTQFVEQNGLQAQAYKKWTTRSGDPCIFCESLSLEDPIPLGDAFAVVGDSINVGGQSLDISYMDLEAGNAHPNCQCIYELIIKT